MTAAPLPILASCPVRPPWTTAAPARIQLRSPPMHATGQHGAGGNVHGVARYAVVLHDGRRVHEDGAARARGGVHGGERTDTGAAARVADGARDGGRVDQRGRGKAGSPAQAGLARDRLHRQCNAHGPVCTLPGGSP